MKDLIVKGCLGAIVGILSGFTGIPVLWAVILYLLIAVIYDVSKE